MGQVPRRKYDTQRLVNELRRKHRLETAECTYCPGDRLLYIDRSDYEPDGFVNICINDRYRVEHIRGDEYWLYDLEDVENKRRIIGSE